MSQYHKILGVPVGASIEEIKKSYRLKSKTLHPDVNPSPNAHQQFVELTEAYQMLVSGNWKKKIFTRTSSAYQAAQEKHRKAQAHFYAQQAAKMKYDEFMNSDLYIAIDAFEAIISYIGFIAVISTLFSIGFLIHSIFKPYGIIFYLLLLAIFHQLVFNLIKNYIPKNNSEKWKTIKKFLVNRSAYYMVAIVLHVFCFFYIGFKTLIPLATIGISFLTTTLLYVIYTTYFSKKNTFKNNLEEIKFEKGKIVRTLVWSPLPITLLLLLNYLISFQETTYQFKYTNKLKNNRTEATSPSTLIYIDNNVFDDFIGPRLFFNIEEVESNNYVEYQIATGILGIKVIKNRRLFFQI